MFEIRTKTPGVNTAPKVEMVSASAPYTALRLYLIPIRVRAWTVFDTYDVDFQLAVAGPATLSCIMGVYKRVGALSATNAAVLVTGTSVTVTGLTAAFQTVALGSTKTLEPGDYFIGFMMKAVDGLAILTCLNSVANQSWVTGDWVYADQGSLALPATVGGLNATYIHAAGEQPFWAALNYSGDVIP